MAISRATATAALEAFQRTAAAAGREYGKPIDAAMALTGGLSQDELLMLGLFWLAAMASDEQLAAARELSGHSAKQPEEVIQRVAAVMQAQLGALPYAEKIAALSRKIQPVTLLRLALACLDQGDMFRRVTPARLVEVLCWEEQPS